jgi:RHS repeat-associated protein
VGDAGAGGATVASYAYSYDLTDRLTGEFDDGTGTSYAYDPAGQLLQAGMATYSYDATGNRTTTVDDVTGPDNQLLNDGTWTYTYDPSGDLISKSQGGDGPSWQYTYNNAGQMTSALETQGGATVVYEQCSYDALGELVQTDTLAPSILGPASTRTLYSYDGGQQWLAQSGLEPTGGGTFTPGTFSQTVYLGNTGQLLAQVGTAPAGWYLTDRQGSVRTLLSADGSSVMGTAAYDAYGNFTTETGLLGASPWFGYDGYRYDGETGLYRTDERMYDPATGRWTSQDPIGFAAGQANLYQYVGNGPTDGTDPTGEFEWGALGEGLWIGVGNIWRGTKKAARELGYLAGDTVKAIVAVDALELNFLFGTPVYVPNYSSSLANGAVDAGRNGELLSYTAARAADAASLGILPIGRAALSGDPQAAGDAAGGAIVAALGAKVGQLGGQALGGAAAAAEGYAGAARLAQAAAEDPAAAAAYLRWLNSEPFELSPAEPGLPVVPSETPAALQNGPAPPVPEVCPKPPGPAALEATPKRSPYDTLNIGAAGEPPEGPNVIQVNISEEDLASFETKGLKVRADGNRLPLADNSLSKVKGNHIPPDDSVARGVVKEGFRVLKPGGTAVFSSAGRNMGTLMKEAGFVDVKQLGLALRTTYHGQMVPPAIEYQGTKPLR